MSADEDPKQGIDIDFVATEGKPDVETEPTMSSELWIIDDNEAMNQSLERAVGHYGKLPELKTYSDAGVALDELKSRLLAGQTLPKIILMDGTLAGPRYWTGALAIADIRKICEEKDALVPEIIAYSSSQVSTGELLEAGANSAIDKSNIKNILEYFKQFK